MSNSVLVPDTVQGAIMLSLIDFFLSFVVIGGIGIILALFPMLNRLAIGREKELIED